MAISSVRNVTGLGQGMTVVGTTLQVDPTNVAYQGLAAGESQVIAVTYDVVDIHGAATRQTANITITGSNDAPTADSELFPIFGNPAPAFNGPAMGHDVDSDDDASTLTYVLDSGPANGTVQFQPDGTFTYTPTPGVLFEGLDPFTYHTVDRHGATSNTATATLIVVLPLAPQPADDLFTTDEQTVLSGNVLADNGNGPDIDLDTPVPTVTQVNGASLASGTPIALASGALLTMNAGGTFDYDPNGAFDGLHDGQTALDGFTYTLSDEFQGVQAQVDITINGIDPPTPDIDAFFANDGRNAVLFNQSGAQGGVAGDFDATLFTDIALNQTTALGDADGDGDLDVFLLETGFVGEIQLLTNQGGDQAGTEGTFVASTLGQTPNAADMALGDVDGDGDLDALLVQNGTNTLLTNQGGAQGGTEGTFAGSAVGSGFSNAIAFGDLDGDGDLDALVANQGSNHLLTNQGGVSGPGTEATFVSSDLGGNATSRDVALGDIDGDGDIDAIVVNDGMNQTLTNQGGAQAGTEGTFITTFMIGGSTDSWSVALGDIDNDGDFDALIANNGANQLLTNQGGAQGGTEGTFVASTLDGGSVASNTLALADIDDDGDLDAVIGNNGTNQLLTNQGGAQGGALGAFVASPLDGGIADSFDVAFGNLDGDGNVAAVDANGLPNINPHGLLPDLFVV